MKNYIKEIKLFWKDFKTFRAWRKNPVKINPSTKVIHIKPYYFQGQITMFDFEVGSKSHRYQALNIKREIADNIIKVMNQHSCFKEELTPNGEETIYRLKACIWLKEGGPWDEDSE